MGFKAPEGFHRAPAKSFRNRYSRTQRMPLPAFPESPGIREEFPLANIVADEFYFKERGLLQGLSMMATYPHADEAPAYLCTAVYRTPKIRYEAPTLTP